MRCGTSVIAAPNPRRARRLALVVAGAGVLSGLAAAAGWASAAQPHEQAILIARYTARVSLGLFLVAYVLGPAWREWLTAFVTAHLAHFVAMLHLNAVAGLDYPPVALGLGLLAYAAPVAVLLVPGAPSARWRWLALHFVWLSFAVTYYHRLFEFADRRADGVFAFVALLAVMGGRIWRTTWRRRSGVSG